RSVGDSVAVWNDLGAAAVYRAGETKPAAKITAQTGVVFVKESAGQFLVGSNGERIIGWDLRTLEEKWSVPIAHSSATIARTVGGTTAVAIVGKTGNALVGIDAAAGTVRWQRPVAPLTILRTSGSSLLWGDDGHVASIDPVTG